MKTRSIPMLAALCLMAAATSACNPSAAVTQATNIVNTATTLAKLVDKFGGGLASISTKGAGGLLNASQFKELIALTEGAETGKLPAKGGLTGVTITQTPKAGAYGILGGGFRLFQASSSARVGMGGASPKDEVDFDEANAKLEAETPLLASSSEVPGNSHYGVLDVPASIDLRAQMPDIRDQGQRGTCVLFSTAAYLDYLYQNNPKAPFKHVSPEFMNWSYNVMIKSQISSYKPELWQDLGSQHALYHTILREGGMSDVVADEWPYVPPQQGAISEDLCPYQPDETYDTPQADFKAMAVKRLGASLESQVEAGQAFPSEGARFFKLKHDIATFKATLAAQQPIQTSLPIYGQDWSNVTASGNYRIPEMNDTKAADTANIGYHSILLVGYQDDASAPGGGWFILRNSWGTDWGNAGYAYLSYAFVMNYGGLSYAAEAYDNPFQATYSITPPSPGASPSPDTTDTCEDASGGDACSDEQDEPLDALPTPDPNVDDPSGNYRLIHR